PPSGKPFTLWPIDSAVNITNANSA
ncbi:uncharacterized protein METZ01_LOCUS367658, partial [marine metagenome]